MITRRSRGACSSWCRPLGHRSVQLGVELAEVMLEHFEDAATAASYFTARRRRDADLRPKTFADDATPAGNGVAARVSCGWATCSGTSRYLDAAERTLRAAHAAMDRLSARPRQPAAWRSTSSRSHRLIVVLRGDTGRTGDLARRGRQAVRPRRMIIAVPSDATRPAGALADKKPLRETAAYLCRGTTCSEPARSLGALLRALKTG
jgi:uncharacterized protein YyaL (SSP411 family)